MSAGESSQPSRAATNELLRAAIVAAERAADVIRAREADAAALEWRAKSPTDFVSDVDTAAEGEIREVLARLAPGAVVIAEEGSPDVTLGDAPGFIVDPLDGTTNFLHGYPAYAVSIAVVERGEVTAGVVVNVVSRDLFTAAAGQGAHRNGQPLRVSSLAEPSRALIGTGFPFKDPRLVPAYVRQLGTLLPHVSGVRRAGAAALDLADVAAGRFDAFWELTLMPWDFAAGLLLIREAGGVVTTLGGGEPPLRETAVVAGNPAMHRWLLDMLVGA